MQTVEVKVRLPADFVEEAQPFGILRQERIEALLRGAFDDAVIHYVNDEVRAY